MNSLSPARCSSLLWLRALLLAVLTALAACSDSPPPAPVISVQPTDQSAAVGSTATLSVAASGPDLAYQWQQSTDAGSTWTAIAGATQASHTTAATTPADNGKRYRVIVSAAGISVTSSAVQLTVTAAVVAPTLTVQPAAQSATAPNAATFSVTVTGTAPAYQWQRSNDGGASWTGIAGATASSYSTGSTDVSMNASQYRVVVSNSAGSVTSAAVVLNVATAPLVAAFTTQPAHQSVSAGSAAAFTVAATGNPTPTLQWQRSTDGGATWSHIATATDATYNTGPTALSQNGERYRALASNSAGSATSSAALLTVTAAPQAPAITVQPSAQSVNAPAAATFAASASGVPTPTWQWQQSSDGGVTWANINGATASSYTTPATAVADSGRRYRAVASNSTGTATTSAALLTVNPAPVVQQWQTAGALRGADGFAANSIRVAAGPNGQFIAAWIDVDASDLHQLRSSRYTPGTGWSSPVVVVSGTTFAAPYKPESHAIAMDASGNAVVLFLVRSGSNLRESLWASRQEPTGPWSAPVLLETQEDGRAELPSIAFDGQGVATAVWQQNDTIFFPNLLTTRRIVASQLVPGAPSWTVPVDIDLSANGNGTSVPIHVKANSSGDVIAAWSTSNNVGQYATANVFRAGAGWVGAQILTNPVSGANSVAYDVAINTTTAVVALSAQSAGVRSVFVARVTGTAWATAEAVDQSSLEADAPTVVLAADGATTVAWQQSSGSSFQVWAARAPAGSAWSVPQRISDAGIAADSPRAGIDAADNVTVVWLRNPGSAWTVVSARHAAGSSWTGAVVIESATTVSSTMTTGGLAVSANGHAAAVWVEGTGSSAAPWANLFR